MSLVLSFDAWPASDRAMWGRLMMEGGPLDDHGALAHLRETSRKSLRINCGRWLGWLAKNEPDALSENPTARITIERLQDWLEDRAHLRPMSRLILLGDTIRVANAAAPAQDWGPHLRLKAHLKRLAGNGDRSRKAGRILSSAILFDAGVKHATSDASEATTTLESMKRRRNGTMVAMLALMPMRRRAFANLRLGESMLIEADQAIVSLPEELTKAGHPWEAAVPNAVLPLVLSYLSDVRPWLMHRGGAAHPVFWVGDRGSAFDDNHLGMKIAGITKRITGVRVPPHFFRDAAATTLARDSPQGAKLIRPVLAHAGFETAERHYIHAGSIEAGRDYAALLKQLKRKA